MNEDINDIEHDEEEWEDDGVNYGEVEYWNERYKGNGESFDW